MGAELWREKVPDAVWKRCPVFGEFRVTLNGDSGFVYQARGEPLGKVLFWRGLDSFEPGSAAVFTALARDAKVFIDVGAYSGLYTLLATTVNRACKVCCFEPVPALRAWLYGNLELNGVEDRVRIVAAAASERPEGTVDFHVSSNAYSPGSSLLRDFGREQRRVVSVPTLSLDRYVMQENLTGVDLIKIDTEGAELQVLQGALELLKAQRPAVLCEILEDGRGHLEGIERLLRDVGYAHAHVTEAGLVRRPRLVPDPARRLRNFLLWPEGRALPAALSLSS